jgi:multidrug efflux pump subunit AcrA (membrane-fusion protein)
VPGGAGRPGGSARPGGSSTGTLYVEVPNAGGKLKPVTVKTLITDGNLTAIQTNDLKEGDEIVVSLATARAGVPGGGTGAPGGGGRRPF